MSVSEHFSDEFTSDDSDNIEVDEDIGDELEEAPSIQEMYDPDGDDPDYADEMAMDDILKYQERN